MTKVSLFYAGVLVIHRGDVDQFGLAALRENPRHAEDVRAGFSRVQPAGAPCIFGQKGTTPPPHLHKWTV